MRKRDFFEGGSGRRGWGRRGGRHGWWGVLRFAAGRRRRGGPVWGHEGPAERPGHHEHGHAGPGFGHEGHGEHPEHRWAGGGRGGWGGRGPGGPGGPGWGGPGGPGWGGPGRPGGPRWGGRGRAGRGDVRAAILTLLAEKPLHGYEIIQQIGERSGGAWRPSPGSVYPALQLLEDQGLIQSQQAEGRRVFQLTEAGRAHVAQHGDELRSAWEAVKGSADDPILELRDLFEQVGGAIRQVAHAGTPAQIAAAQKLLAGTRRQLYRILAEDDVPAEQAPGDAQ